MAVSAAPSPSLPESARCGGGRPLLRGSDDVNTRSVEGLEALAHGPLHRFADPLDPSIPLVVAGCYTIWDRDRRYLYAGMAGRSLTVESIAFARTAGRTKPSGLLDRLNAHRNGRRSGDQFCVYIFDFLCCHALPPTTSPPS